MNNDAERTCDYSESGAVTIPFFPSDNHTLLFTALPEKSYKHDFSGKANRT